MQAVPTGVVVGPDGYYYVSQLTGFPFPIGGAKIFRVNPRTGVVHDVRVRLHNAMDLAFGPDGTLYVLEIDHDSLFPPAGPSTGALRGPARRRRQRIEVPRASSSSRAASRSPAARRWSSPTTPARPAWASCG